MQVIDLTECEDDKESQCDKTRGNDHGDNEQHNDDDDDEPVHVVVGKRRRSRVAAVASGNREEDSCGGGSVAQRTSRATGNKLQTIPTASTSSKSRHKQSNRKRPQIPITNNVRSGGLEVKPVPTTVVDEDSSNNNLDHHDHLPKRAQRSQVKKPPKVHIGKTVDANKNRSKFQLVNVPPTTVDDLCLRPKKVKEIQTWLQRAVDNSVKHSKPSLLFLVGPPGTGKSTVIDVLSQKMHLQLTEWEDNGKRGDVPSKAGDSSSQLSFGYVSVLSSFRSFLSSSSKFPALDLETTTQDETSTASSLSTTCQPKASGKVLLLHDIPRANNASKEMRDYIRNSVQEGLRNYLSFGRYPLIVLLSSGGEEEESANTKTVQRLVSNDIYAHPCTSIIEVRPVTEVRMRNALICLFSLCTKESRMKAQEKWKNLIDNVVRSAGGDLRHAISTCSFWVHEDDEKIEQREIPCGRDKFYGVLHSLGKLLYAKRDANGRLENDHEQVAADSGLDPSALSSFMHENCVELFSDIHMLSQTLDALCVSDFIQSSKYRIGLSGSRTASLKGHEPETQGDVVTHNGQSIFPDSYSSCIASRSVSSYNTAPLTAGFRQLCRPISGEMERTRAHNYRWITHGGLGGNVGLNIKWVKGDSKAEGETSTPHPDCSFDSARDRCVWKIPFMSTITSFQSSYLRTRGMSGVEISLLQAASRYGTTRDKATQLIWDRSIQTEISNEIQNNASQNAEVDENSEDIED